jgi:drug/metabolite transporter (DMT)-like permease
VTTQTAETSLLAGAAYGSAASLIWAGFPAVTKLAMASQALTAWDVTALRFGVAGLILAPILLRRGFKGLRWPAVLLLACGAGAPYVLLTAGGLAFAPAGHMGIITPSCMLLTTTLGSWLLLGDRLTAGRIAGALTILIGLVMLGWDGLANHGDLAWLGDLMFVAGGLFWASYTIGSRYWAVEPFQATVIVSAVSLLLYVPAYAALTGATLAAAPWQEIAIQAVFQGLLSAIVALICYTRAVKMLGAARGAVFAALVPSFSLLVAIPMLHEIPTRLQIVGVLFVTAGMVLALGLYDRAKWRRSSRPLAAPAHEP